MSLRKPPRKARRVVRLLRILQKKLLWSFLAVVDTMALKPSATKIALIVCSSLLAFGYVIMAAMFQWNELMVFIPALLFGLLFLFAYEKASKSEAIRQRRAAWQHRRPNPRPRSRTRP